MSRLTRSPGFTLVELMISCSLLVIFCTVTVQMGLRVHAERDAAESYATDLQELRRALRTLAGDVRVARGGARAGDALLLAGEEGSVSFSVQDGALVRVDADGHSRAVARSVAALETTTRGDLVTLRLRLRRRSEGAAAPAAVSTQVRLRSGAGGGR